MIKVSYVALAGWLIGLECHPTNVGGLVPIQGTSLGCSLFPNWRMFGKQPIDVSMLLSHNVSLSLPLFFPLPLKSVNISSSEIFLTKVSYAKMEGDF